MTRHIDHNAAFRKYINFAITATLDWLCWLILSWPCASGGLIVSLTLILEKQDNGIGFLEDMHLHLWSLNQTKAYFSG